MPLPPIPPSRRKKNRYAHGNLRVTVLQARIAGLWHQEQAVTWMDFNSLGMAFATNEHHFRIGARLRLNLSIDDEQSVAVQNIIAVVRNINANRYNCRYGVEFDFEANEHMRSRQVQQQLENIEQILEAIFLRLADLEGENSN